MIIHLLWKNDQRCNTSIDNSKDNFLKHIANPSFDNLIKINDNISIINKFKNKVTLGKPCYAGVAV